MKCSFRRLPQHAGRICWRWSDAQQWRGRRGAEMERARCKHPTFSQTAGVGWRDPETKNCVFVFSGSFPLVLALVLCLLSVLSSFICPSFHLPLFLVLCFHFVCPFFSIVCFLPFFLLSFSYNICTQRSKGVTGWCSLKTQRPEDGHTDIWTNWI